MTTLRSHPFSASEWVAGVVNASCIVATIHRSSEKANSANFAMKLSEESQKVPKRGLTGT